MDKQKAIQAIVHLETTAEYYCAEGSKRQRDCLADAYQLRMQQEPPETRKRSVSSQSAGKSVYRPVAVRSARVSIRQWRNSRLISASAKAMNVGMVAAMSSTGT